MNSSVPIASPVTEEALTSISRARARESRHTEDLEGETSDEKNILLMRSVAAVLRFKWMILALVALSVAAGFYIKNQYAPEYEVEGKIWIAPTGQEGNASREGPVRGATLLPANSWSDLLSSYAVVGQAVRELHLYIQAADPRHEKIFSAADVAEPVKPGSYILRVDTTSVRYRLARVNGREETVVEQGLVGDSVGRSIGLRWLPERGLLERDHAIAFFLTTPRLAALAVQSSVRAVLPWQGNIMRVYVTGSSPWRVSALAGSLLRHLVETADDFKRRNVVDVRKALEVQLAFASSALQQADGALERFRTETITLPSVQPGPEASAGSSEYFKLKVTQETVAHQRAALEKTLSDIQAGRLDVEALWQVLPTDAGTQDIGALLQEYAKRQSQLRNDLMAFTEDYQGIKEARAAQAELRTQAIPRMVNTLLVQLKRREDDLSQRTATESATLHAIPPRMIEEVRLTREVEARRQLYDMLQRRYEEARLAELSVAPDLAVLDVPGVPEWPISNKGRQVFLMVVAAGAGAAVVLALLLDRLDRRIRYLQQIPNRLRLHVIGAVPSAARRRTRDPLNTAQLVEAFRSIRLGAMYASSSGRPFLLTITSAGEGEGKSFVSANLALAFAEAGYRTLLVDGDLRRGRLHETFDTEARPGLVDVLRGSAPLAGSIVATSHAKLSLLPCGARLKSAPELLTSDAFRQLTETLLASYDVILIDSPPLAAGMDPHALCVATGDVLFVVRMNQTDGTVARRKLDVLERFPVHVLGAVANDVSTALGLNDDYSYLPAYTIAEEDEAVSSHAMQVVS